MTVVINNKCQRDRNICTGGSHTCGHSMQQGEVESLH